MIRKRIIQTVLQNMGINFPKLTTGKLFQSATVLNNFSPPEVFALARF